MDDGFGLASLIVGRMMAQERVGFFGGSFDPPHRGHLVVARAAAEAFELDRVLLAPTASQPLKPEGAEASFADRLEMVRLLCEGVAGLKASDVDGPKADGTPNYTVETLRGLRKDLGPDALVFVIVGVDAFLGLAQWKSADELLRVAEWVVVTRPGFAVERLSEMGLSLEQRLRVHVLDGVAEMVSATQVRERLKEDVGCEDLVPAKVLEYIRRRHLYGT